MNRHTELATSVLWATAIVASAVLEAPTSVTLLLLPALAVASLLVGRSCRSGERVRAGRVAASKSH